MKISHILALSFISSVCLAKETSPLLISEELIPQEELDALFEEKERQNLSEPITADATHTHLTPDFGSQDEEHEEDKSLVTPHKFFYKKTPTKIDETKELDPSALQAESLPASSEYAKPTNPPSSAPSETDSFSYNKESSESTEDQLAPLSVQTQEPPTSAPSMNPPEYRHSSLQVKKYQPPVQNSECGFNSRPYRISVRHIESKGVGYNKGYTTLEGFFIPPSCINTSFIPFFDLRGHVFNDGKPAANAGFGARYIASRTWGINAYYDYRKTHHMHYNQVSLGLESLGDIWDFRVNGYLPIGDKQDTFSTRFHKFKGHHMILSQKREFAMKGLNGEVGAHIDKFRNIPIYVAAGPYYFEGQGKNAIGGNARISAQFYKCLALEVSAFYDSFFHGGIQGELSVIFPFGPKKSKKARSDGTCPANHRIFQAVDRSEIVVVGRKHHHSIAKDRRTHDPIYFVFVDNQSHSQGTFESPYNTMTAAMDNSSPGDVIYVFPGDGTANGLRANVILQDNQRLLSSSIPHTFRTTKGKVKVHPTTSELPFLTNSGLSGGAVVTLANNCEVSGFEIENVFTGGSNAGVYGIGISNPSVNHNKVFTTYDGISLDSVVGTARVTANTVIATSTTSTTGIIFGAVLPQGLLNQNVIVKYNQILLAPGGLFSFGILERTTNPAGSSKTYRTEIRDNVIALTSLNIGPSVGLRLSATNAQNPILANLSGNTISIYSTHGASAGIQLLQNAGAAAPICLDLNKNSVTFLNTTPAGAAAYSITNSSGTTTGTVTLNELKDNEGTPFVSSGVTLGSCD